MESRHGRQGAEANDAAWKVCGAARRRDALPAPPAYRATFAGSGANPVADVRLAMSQYAFCRRDRHNSFGDNFKQAITAPRGWWRRACDVCAVGPGDQTCRSGVVFPNHNRALAALSYTAPPYVYAPFSHYQNEQSFISY